MTRSALLKLAAGRLQSDGRQRRPRQCREVSAEEYAAWEPVYRAAKTALQDREAGLDAAAELIEKDLLLLGATAIEDKLQEVGLGSRVAAWVFNSSGQAQSAGTDSAGSHAIPYRTHSADSVHPRIYYRGPQEACEPTSRGRRHLQTCRQHHCCGMQGVPACIEKLRHAGLKIWVLTGDKVRTLMTRLCVLF